MPLSDSSIDPYSQGLIRQANPAANGTPHAFPNIQLAKKRSPAREITDWTSTEDLQSPLSQPLAPLLPTTNSQTPPCLEPAFLANAMHGHASTLTLCNVPMCSQPLAYTFSAPIHEPLSPCLSSPRKNTVCNNAWSCINFGAVKRAYAQSAVSAHLFRAHLQTLRDFLLHG